MIGHSRGKCILLLTLALLVFSSAAFGAVIRVKPTGNDGNNGSSWALAKQTVQGGINAASASDEVWVAAGTYYEVVNLADGVDVYGGFAGTETLRTSRDWRQNETIIDGGGTAYDVVAADGITGGVRFDGFTMCNSLSAGIGIDDTILTVASCTIEETHESGIVSFSGSTLTVINSIIECNDAEVSGGGIWLNATDLDIRNNLIFDNAAIGSYGGGIYCSGCTGTIANNTIAWNTALGGGGIYALNSSTLDVTNNIAAFNSSGIYKDAGSTLTLSYNCVYGNISYDYSGCSAGATDIQVDPLLVAPALDNCRLQPDSPCREAGDNTAVSAGDKDLDNQPRILGPTVDIGADEYKGHRFDIDEDGEDDLIGLASNGSIWHSTNKTTWTKAVGSLATMVVGDFDGDGGYEPAGLSAGGQIWCVIGEFWQQVPGSLSTLAVGDYDGNGSDDLGGLNASGLIWCTTDKQTWTQVPGALSQLDFFNAFGETDEGLLGLGGDGSVWCRTTDWCHIYGTMACVTKGDLLGDGYDDLVGLGQDGRIWYNYGWGWHNVPGSLASVSTGDLDGDGLDEIVGLAGNGTVWCTGDRTTWTNIPGILSSLVVGDFDGDGDDDIAGLGSNGKIWYTTNKTSWTNIPGTLSTLLSAR